jgi:amino acid transporter
MLSAADAAPALKRELRLWDLVFLNVAAVASIRWIGAAAHAGPGSITLWMLAIAGFFIPSAFVVSSLSQRFPDEGGLYIWSKRAFGDWHGFNCAWLYFLSNLLFVPSLALTGVAISAYIWHANPAALAQNRPYTITFTLLLLSGAYLAHLFGLKIGKWAGNIGGGATYISAALLVAVAGWIAWRHGSVTHFKIMPAPSWDTLNTWSQIAFALVGLELGPILGGEIINPRRNVPRAAWISALGCAAFYVAGTTAVLVLVTPPDANQITGPAQAGLSAGLRLGWSAFSPTFALLIVCGIFGSLASWIAGNTRLPFVIGLDHYLPEAFARLHPRWGTPYVSILFQAGASMVLLGATQAGETVSAAYQILVDMTVITTLLPYVYIFCAGWKFGQPIASACGFTISVAAIALSLVPPPEVTSWQVFELKVVGGSLFLTGIGWIIFARRTRSAR